MLLWNGACMVHEIFSLEKITKLKNPASAGKTNCTP
jgi:quinolinate synthase